MLRRSLSLGLLFVGALGACNTPQPSASATTGHAASAAEPVTNAPAAPPAVNAAAQNPGPTPPSVPTLQEPLSPEARAAAGDTTTGLGSRDPVERTRAVWNERGYSETLAALVNDDDPAVRRAALTMLGRSRDPRGIPTLNATLVAGNPNRMYAAESLVMIGNDQAISTVREYREHAPAADQRRIDEILTQFGRH